jgi:ribosomal protein S18 acetylase RimI-like enzyme
MQATDPALLFPNPPLASLSTAFAAIALRRGLALKFPREITPFAALLENTPAALADFHSLLEPGEATFVVSFDLLPAAPGISAKGPYFVRQFEFPADAPLPSLSPNLPIAPLTCAHAAEMVSLTDIAFPGYFRIRTCEMGPYFGLRSSGRLVAMCGERMNINTPAAAYREISGLCTLPEFRGRGYGPSLLAHMLHLHRTAGMRSYLHVAPDNATAIALYQRLGFVPRGEFPLYSIRRLT